MPISYLALNLMLSTKNYPVTIKTIKGEVIKQSKQSASLFLTSLPESDIHFTKMNFLDDTEIVNLSEFLQ